MAIVGFLIKGYVPVQLGEPVEKVLPRRVRSFGGAAIAHEILAPDIVWRIPSHVCTRAESPPHAGQDYDAHVGIVVASTHVFTHLGHGAVLLRGADQGIHAFRSVELDPQDVPTSSGSYSR